MKPLLKSKVTRKLLIMAVMILGLAFVISDEFTPTVSARPCCETCPGGGDPMDAEALCYYGCYYGGAPNPSQCYQDCMYDANRCLSSCIYCDSPSGPGGSCMGTSDCPIGYYCDSSNICVRL